MELVEVAPNLWVADQSLRFLTLEVGSRMTVVRLSNGDIVLISPIAMDDGDRDAMDGLGTVRHIIAPNLFHHLSAGTAQALWPDAELWGPPGLAEKRSDLTFDRQLADTGQFGGVLDYLSFEGVAALLPTGIYPFNERVFCHHPSGTLIVTDTAFNIDRDNTWRTRWVMKLLGSYGTLRPSLLEKWGTRDKDVVERSLRQVLAWDFDRAIPGHGSIVKTGAKAQLKAGYEWLLGRSLS